MNFAEILFRRSAGNSVLPAGPGEADHSQSLDRRIACVFDTVKDKLEAVLQARRLVDTGVLTCETPESNRALKVIAIASLVVGAVVPGAHLLLGLHLCPAMIGNLALGVEMVAEPIFHAAKEEISAHGKSHNSMRLDQIRAFVYEFSLRMAMHAAPDVLKLTHQKAVSYSQRLSERCLEVLEEMPEEKARELGISAFCSEVILKVDPRPRTVITENTVSLLKTYGWNPLVNRIHFLARKWLCSGQSASSGDFYWLANRLFQWGCRGKSRILHGYPQVDQWVREPVNTDLDIYINPYQKRDKFLLDAIMEIVAAAVRRENCQRFWNSEEAMEVFLKLREHAVPPEMRAFSAKLDRTTQLVHAVARHVGLDIPNELGEDGDRSEAERSLRSIHADEWFANKPPRTLRMYSTLPYFQSPPLPNKFCLASQIEQLLELFPLDAYREVDPGTYVEEDGERLKLWCWNWWPTARFLIIADAVARTKELLSLEGIERLAVLSDQNLLKRRPSRILEHVDRLAREGDD